MSQQADAERRYWHANLKLVAILLLIWFAVSYGCGILFADALNGVRLGGYKLGFWFAQQGSIMVFVVLIFIYAWRMQKLDSQLPDSDDGDAANTEGQA